MITNSVLGVPYYKYRYNGPQNPILIIKAPTSRLRPRAGLGRMCADAGSRGLGLQLAAVKRAVGSGRSSIRRVAVTFSRIELNGKLLRNVKLFRVPPKPPISSQNMLECSA